MKIAIVTWGLSKGALTNVTSALTTGLWNIGARDLAVLYLSHGPGEHNPIPRGVKLVSLGVRRARWAAVPLAKYLRRARPDILISMPSIMSIPAVMAHLLSRRSGTKLIVNQADTLNSDVFIDHRTSPRMRSVPWLAKALYPRADGLVAVCEGVLNILRQSGISLAKDRMTMIPNPVDVEGVAARSLGKADHPWIGKNGVPTIVSLGRLVKRKDFETLITAFAILRKSIDAKLIIFGEGPERSALEKLVAKLGLKDVSLPGFSDNPFSNIRNADLFVMSSLDEAFCLVLVEAMACGVPVISTDAVGGGPRSILGESRHGLLVPVGDAQRLADAMSRVLTSRDSREQLALAGTRRCEEFKPERVAHQWLTFIGSCASHDPR